MQKIPILQEQRGRIYDLFKTVFSSFRTYIGAAAQTRNDIGFLPVIPRGSDGRAAGGGRSDLSEWLPGTETGFSPNTYPPLRQPVRLTTLPKGEARSGCKKSLALPLGELAKIFDF